MWSQTWEADPLNRVFPVRIVSIVAGGLGLILLLMASANPWLFQPLHAAARAGDSRRVTACIRPDRLNAPLTCYWPSLDRGKTPLMIAAEQGHSSVVVALLDAGASPNVTKWTGDTALILSAQAGHLECVRVLLARGARADLKGLDGHTALEEAAEGGHHRVVEELAAAMKAQKRE